MSKSLLQSPTAALRQGIVRDVVDHEVDVNVNVSILAQGFLSAAVEPLIGPTSPLTRSVRFHCLFFAPISRVTKENPAYSS
jgi:hypothetical protein